MTPWSSYAPWVQPIVPGCPEPMVHRAICDAAVEFCEFTHAFTETGTLAVTAGRAAYEIDAGDGVPLMLLGVSAASTALAPTTIEQLMLRFGNTWRTHTGSPQAYLGDGEAVLHLYPIPDADLTLSLSVAIGPSRADIGWDDRLFERYGEIVGSGALARLLAQTSASWANPATASYHQMKFQRGMNKVRSRHLTSYVPITPFVTF